MAGGRRPRVGLFGPLTVRFDGDVAGPRDLGGRKPKQVLQLLVTHHGEAVPKDRLIDLLWSARLPADPVRTLEASVSVLRRHLHPDPSQARRLVASEPGAYRVPLDAAEVDLWTFDDLVGRARALPGSDGSALRSAALDLVRGDVLADEPYAEWAIPLRDLYRERVVNVLLDEAEAVLVGGDPAGALRLVEQALAAQPLRERAHRLAIAAQAVLGEGDRALAAYDRCREALVAELGVTPLPETERVYLAVLNQEPPGDVVQAAVGNGWRASTPVGVQAVRPATRFAWSRGSSIAYQALGAGAPDVVVAPGWFSHVEVGWEEPRFSRFLQHLARGRRVLLFDRRGTGMSDPVPADTDFDERADDIVAVMDAAGSDRAVVFGISEGGPMGVSVAARRPERVEGLVLYSCYGRLMAAPDYPWGWSQEFLELYQGALEAAWTTGHGMEMALPSVSGDDALRDWVCRYLRLAVSPATARAALVAAARTDVRAQLPAVRCPTLVLHRRDERWISPENGRYVASRIADARFVEVPGVDYWPWLGDDGDVDAVLREVDRFLEGFPRVGGAG